MNRWTFWYDNPGRKASKETWSEQLKPLLTFGTIEDFWGAYNNLRPASSLSAGSNYHLFKGEIRLQIFVFVAMFISFHKLKFEKILNFVFFFKKKIEKKMNDRWNST